MKIRFPKYLSQDVTFFGLKLNDIMGIAIGVVLLGLINVRIEYIFTMITITILMIFNIRRKFPRYFLRHLLESKMNITFSHMMHKCLKKKK